MEKQTLTIGSGETYEWLVDLGQQNFHSTYSLGTQTRYDPESNNPKFNSDIGFPAIPDYIGGPIVTGLGPAGGGDFAGLTGSQYFPFHNHDDYKATNNGVYPGGMFTMIVPTP